MILLDTSGVLAWIDAGERSHALVAAVMEEASGPFLLSPFVLAELDYLIRTRISERARDLLLAQVERGAFRLAELGPGDLRACRSLLAKFADQGISLADASISVLATRERCWQVLTLDQRHFRLLPGPGGEPLRLLPADD